MKQDIDGQYWQKRYELEETGWDAGTVTQPIREFIDTIVDTSLSVLIPGAGNGHEAEYFWKRGFRRVFVLDIAPAPLDNLKRRLPDFPEEQLLLGDFFSHQGQYDLVIEQTFFCAIDPRLRSLYAKHMHTLLKPQGKLCGVMFGVPMNSDQPPFGGSKEEYISYFCPLFSKVNIEVCNNSIAPRAGKELWVELTK